MQKNSLQNLGNIGIVGSSKDSTKLSHRSHRSHASQSQYAAGYNAQGTNPHSVNDSINLIPQNKQQSQVNYAQQLGQLTDIQYQQNAQ